MHTATLKSGEGAHQRRPWPGAPDTSGQGGAGRERTWAAGKTLGLKQTLPRQTQIQVPGKKRGESESPTSQSSPSSDPLAQMWGHMWVPGMIPGLSAVMPVPPLGPGLVLGRKCLLPGMGGGEVRGRRIFWFFPFPMAMVPLL